MSILDPRIVSDTNQCVSGYFKIFENAANLVHRSLKSYNCGTVVVKYTFYFYVDGNKHESVDWRCSVDAKWDEDEIRKQMMDRWLRYQTTTKYYTLQSITCTIIGPF